METDFGFEGIPSCFIVNKYTLERISMCDKRDFSILEKVKRVYFQDIAETDCLNGRQFS